MPREEEASPQTAEDGEEREGLIDAPGRGALEMVRGVGRHSVDEERSALAPNGAATAPPGPARGPHFWSKVFLGAGLLLIFVIILAASLVGHQEERRDAELQAVPVAKLAFGSCTSYNLGYQPIWTDAVVPAEPDAWIWAGDFSYLDDPMLNCEVEADTPAWQEQCNCSNSFIAKRPHSCMAGDVDNAQRRWLAQLRDPGYAAFLEFMCPGAAAEGFWPPPGTDLERCPRSIVGTWDDHDSGWNNDDDRLPSRQVFKHLYLDAIGDPQDSPRRGSQHGIWHKFTLNAIAKGKQASLYQSGEASTAGALALEAVGVDVFLLDERYERETIPCETRKEWCRDYVINTVGDVWSNRDYAWCYDFVYGGADGFGSCCDKDAKLLAWCDGQKSKAEAQRSVHYAGLCDFGHDRYGMESLTLNSTTGDYEVPNYAATVDDLQSESPFCEVLGRRQRAWLKSSFAESTARLKLIVSGSVLLGNPWEEMPCSGAPDIFCPCSADDWECYGVAKREMLHRVHALQQPGKTCAIVLTGDYHFSDFKILQPGPDTPYAADYESQDFKHPVVQFMSSGLTHTTASATHGCTSWKADQKGLRAGGHCTFYNDPSFGMLRFETGDGNPISKGTDRIDVVRMQIITADGNVGLEQVFDMSTCALKA